MYAVLADSHSCSGVCAVACKPVASKMAVTNKYLFIDLTF